MTARSVYATLVDQVFGPESATFDTMIDQSNLVIGALARADHFSAFKANFEGRLRRLNDAAIIDTNLRAEILAAVNRIADSGWDGAYAELCALDYFLAASETGPKEVTLDHTVPASDTLASEMGMQNANHDMRFSKLGISMDTKLLSDKTGEILKGIFDDYRSAKGIDRLAIIPSYNLGDDFVQYAQNRKALLKELIDEVDTTIQPRTYKSKILPGLSYTFAWKAGVHFGESTYNPDEHARLHHPLLFGHAKKFSRVEPTIISLIIFPWSGEKIYAMEDGKRRFFKKFGMHFFEDYNQSGEQAKTFNSKFKTNILARDVASHLSGIIFLEDNCIMGTDPSQLNVDASFIWNDNAVHSLSGHNFDAMMRRRKAYDLKGFMSRNTI